MNQADRLDPEDVGAVGPDPVLHEGALLALDPGHQRRKHERDEREEDDRYRDRRGIHLRQLAPFVVE